MSDSLSRASDAQLLAIAEQVIATAAAAPATYGTTVGTVTALDALKDAFSANLTDHVAAQAAAKAQTSKKDGSRDALEQAIRALRNVATGRIRFGRRDERSGYSCGQHGRSAGSDGSRRSGRHL
jgi:ABC-type branched-subunit amino acid transport system substrate-binding protein